MQRKHKFVSLFLIVSMILFIGCSNNEIEDQNLGDQETEEQESETKYTAGEYTAVGQGHEGDIHITVTFSEDEIADIVVDEHSESMGLGNVPLQELPKQIIEKQSIGIDTMTGATISSMALIKAVEDAVKQADGDIENLKHVDEKDDDTQNLIELETDVLIIGGGGSGLAASIEAARAGAEVIILEKLDYLGGDTRRAGGGAEAAGTTFQKDNGIDDKPEDFADFIRSRGVSFRNPKLLDKMVEESADSIYFLAEMGADMSVQVPGHGSPVARAHRPKEGHAGENIVLPMIDEIKDLPIDVYCGTPAYELMTENDKVIGAKAHNTRTEQEYEIKAKAVIISTGNFASNNEMLGKYNERLKGIDTNSADGSQGDGIVMATDVGADIEMMDIVRVTTGMPRGIENHIAVNQDGERFMDEYYSADTIFVEGDDLHIQAIENYDDKYYWVIVDDKVYSEHGARLTYGKPVSNFVEAETIEELASVMEIEASNLKETIDNWNSFVESGEDTQFGRTEGMQEAINKEPYHAIKFTPRAHNTAGGIRINTDAEVLDDNEVAIPGLYAGGEVTGGVHDGVSAVCSAMVYGRISGINAANYALE